MARKQRTPKAAPAPAPAQAEEAVVVADLQAIVAAPDATVALPASAEPLPSRSIVPVAYRAACHRDRERKTAGGNVSVDRNDALAVFLRGRTVADVAAIAEQAGCGSAAALLERYAALNAGQQRMNIGNRIRAAVKAGAWTVPTAQ